MQKLNEIQIGNNFKSVFKDGKWEHEYIEKSKNSDIVKNNVKVEYKEKPEYELLEQLEVAEKFYFDELLKEQNKEILLFINKNVKFDDIK